jgi:hypothetical protein
MSDSVGTPKWFTQFPEFTYDHSAGVQSNFYRLAKARQWGAILKGKHWAACQTSLFDSLYGTDTTKLEIWQDLCREVHIRKPPGSIKQCKKVFVRLFSSNQALICGLPRFSEAATFW